MGYNYSLGDAILELLFGSYSPLLILIVLVVITLILREVVCWYWKINSMLIELRQTNYYLEKNLKAINEINTAINGIFNLLYKKNATQNAAEHEAKYE